MNAEVNNKMQYFQNSYYVDLANNNELKISFNIWAAIFGAGWCFYRKLYIVGFVYFITYFILNTILAYILNNTSATTITVVNIIFFRVFLGFIVNGIYIKKSLKEIDKIVTAVDHADVASKLKAAGGVSEISVVIYYVISIGLNVCLMLAGIKL